VHVVEAVVAQTAVVAWQTEEQKSCPETCLKAIEVNTQITTVEFLRKKSIILLYFMTKSHTQIS